MNYKSIKQEAKLCRVAFKGAKVGDLVWFCHHEIPIEILTEPPKNRIKFILSNKAQAEQAIRLHWFRPCKIELPPELDAARSKLVAARSKLVAARSKLVAARSKLDAARSAWDTAQSKLDAARSDLNAAQSKLDAAYSKLVAARSAWNTPSSKWDAAYSKLEAAQSNLNTIISKYADEISALVKLHLPGCPWDGYTLFPEEKPR